MKKKLASVLLCTAMVCSALAGCTNSEAETAAVNATTAGAAVEGATTEASGNGIEGKVFAIVTKAAGNPYNEKEAQGFQEVIEAMGGTCIVKHPEQATADAQVSVIDLLD